MGEQNDLVGKTGPALQKQRFIISPHMSYGDEWRVFFHRAFICSLLPQSSPVFGTLRPSPALWMYRFTPFTYRYFKTLKTLLKFFMSFFFRPASRDGNIILYFISFLFLTIHRSFLSHHLIGVVSCGDREYCILLQAKKFLTESSSLLPKISFIEPEQKLEHSQGKHTHTYTLTHPEVLITEHQKWKQYSI